MRYYEIETKVGLTEGGTYQLTPSSANDTEMLFWDAFPNTNPKICFELDSKTYLTDVLSQATIHPSGFIISEKLKNLLVDYKLINHKYYEVSLKHNLKDEVKYYWLHLVVADLHKHVDYSKSKFYTTMFGFREDDIEVASFGQYEEKNKKLGINGWIESDLIVFKEDYVLPYDLFFIKYFNEKIYVSEKLKERLEDEEITGLDLIKTENLLV